MVEALRESVVKSFEERLPAALKEILPDMVKTQVEGAVQLAADLAVQRAVTGKDATGVAPETKMKFVNMVKTVIFEGTKAKSLIDMYQDNIGGVLVPTEVAAGILRIAESVGIVAAQARKLPMAGVAQMSFPRYTGSVLQGSYVGHGVVGTSESVTFGDATLIKQTWQTIFRIGNGMFKNANQSVADFLMALVAEGLEYQLENQAFIGTGAPFVGLFQDSTVNVTTLSSGQTSFASATIDDLLDMPASLKPAALVDAGYFMHRTVWNMFRKKKDGDNRYLIDSNMSTLVQSALNPNPAIRPAGYIDGYPVYLSEVLPALSASAISTKFVVFGSLKNLLFGDGGEMTISKSDSATVDGVNVFAANQSAIRVTHDHALVVGLGAGFNVMKTAAA